MLECQVTSNIPILNYIMGCCGSSSSSYKGPKYGSRGHKDDEVTVVDLQGKSKGGCAMCCFQCLMCCTSMNSLLKSQGITPDGRKEDFVRAEERKMQHQMKSPSVTFPNFVKGIQTRHITYPNHTDGFENDALLYTPATPEVECSTTKPIIVYIHGGGWVVGDAKTLTYDPLCKKLCQKLDCYILSVNYRMAPEHPYPVPLEDCYSVLSWLGNMKLSQDFVPEVVDRNRVILMGDSAGGNLAAATAMLWRDRGLAGITVVHQVLLYPCFCTRPLTESRTNAALSNKAMLLKPWMMDFYERMYTPDGKTVEDMSNDPYVNCTSANDLTMLPPITGLVGGADILRDEGVAYFVKVAREGNGVDVEWRQWDYAIHGFCVFPGKDADNALAYITERLRPYMDPVSNV